jgi:hypothetical protein
MEVKKIGRVITQENKLWGSSAENLPKLNDSTLPLSKNYWQ